MGWCRYSAETELSYLKETHKKEVKLAITSDHLILTTFCFAVETWVAACKPFLSHL